MPNRLSEDAIATIIETTDIGGSSVATAWVPMRDFNRVYAIVEVGTWNATDDVDGCRLEQATSSAGAGAKDLTSDESGGNYDTDNPVDADGDQVILEAKAEDFDADNGFNHVRLIVSEVTGTGTDNITGVLIRHESSDKVKEKQGAAAVGSQVYVTPSS